MTSLSGVTEEMKALPKIDLSYWVLMLLCTTMGELIGNLLSRNFALGYTQGAILDVCIFSATILIVLSLKLKNEIFYWLLILMGNIGGTNLADWVTLDPLENDMKWGLLKPLQLGTVQGSMVVMGSLLVILFIRYLVSKKDGDELGFLSKLLYWAAILLSSTFGTTSGDYITSDTPLGALWGSVFLMVILGFLYAAYKYRRLGSAPTYWSSLVVMHPVGATLGNYVSKPIGLNLGNVYTNIVMGVLFVVIYFRKTRHMEC